MNNPDNFRKLDLIECEKIAHRWGKEYPFIKKISLYAGCGGIDYVPVAEVGLNRAVNYTKFQKDWTRCSQFGGFSNPIFWDNRNSTLGYKEGEKSRPEPVIEFNDAKARWEFKTLLNKFSEQWRYIIKEPGISKARASHIDSCMLGQYPWDLYDSEKQDVEDPKKASSTKKLRPSTEVKNKVQEIARRLYHEHPEFDTIKQVAERPEVLQAGGEHYRPKTRHTWVASVAPPEAKKPGIRRKNSQK